MAETNNNQVFNFDPGQPLMQWEFPEYVKHDRSPWWYLVAVGLGLALMIWAILDGNFLFALIILLIGFIQFADGRGEPKKIPFAIYERGVAVGRQFYLFRELQSFAVVYEPPIVERLYIKPKNAIIRTEISIPLEGVDPLRVRSLLLDFVYEDLDHDQESNSDAVERFFKIQ